jgi:hypothetical protein
VFSTNKRQDFPRNQPEQRSFAPFQKGLQNPSRKPNRIRGRIRPIRLFQKVRLPEQSRCLQKPRRQGKRGRVPPGRKTSRRGRRIGKRCCVSIALKPILKMRLAEHWGVFRDLFCGGADQAGRQPPHTNSQVIHQAVHHGFSHLPQLAQLVLVESTGIITLLQSAAWVD